MKINWVLSITLLRNEKTEERFSRARTLTAEQPNFWAFLSEKRCGGVVELRFNHFDDTVSNPE